MKNFCRQETKISRITTETHIKSLKYCHQATSKQPKMTLSRLIRSTQMTFRNSSAPSNSAKLPSTGETCPRMKSIELIACILVAYSARILTVNKLSPEIIHTKAFLSHLYNRITSSKLLPARAKRRTMVCRWLEGIPKGPIDSIQTQKLN